MQAEAGRGPILLLVEELQGRDEGSDVFSLGAARALAESRPLVSHLTPPLASWLPSPMRLLARYAKAARLGLEARAHRPRPSAILFVPASRVVTAAALIRARLLRLLVGAPIAIASFHEGIPRGARLAAGLLGPDLLLLTTEAECAAARAVGFRAELIWPGVNSERFRPVPAHEKRELRLRHGVRASDFVVLHVGHLFENRNLRALIPLAAEAGVSVVIVASSLRRHPESALLQRDLEAHGFLLVEGYQPRLEELYQLADCYVFPTVLASGAVATPLSVLEARACGLPVVTRRFRALGERLGAELGLELVDSGRELVERTLAIRRTPNQNSALPAAYCWAGVARRLLELLDGLSTRPLKAEHRLVGEMTDAG